MWLKNKVLYREEYFLPDETDFIRLNLNESAYPLPDWLKEKILGRLKEANWHYYPPEDNSYLLSLTADYIHHQPEGILLGNGSNELIQTVIYACCDSREAIVTLRPGFSIYKNVAELMNIEVIEVPLREDLSFDLDGILRAAQNARILFLTTPHNPTGLALTAEQIEKIMAETKNLVVLDEAYAEFSEETFLPLLSRYDNLIILRTFSKAFRFAGGRFGYLAGKPDMVKALKAARLPFSVGLFQQIAAEVLLEEKDFILKEVKKIVAERERLFHQLKALSSFKPIPSKANFLLVESSLLEAREVYNRLLRKKILVRVFCSPELRYRFRVTVGQPGENDLLVKALSEIEMEVRNGKKS